MRTNRPSKIRRALRGGLIAACAAVALGLPATTLGATDSAGNLRIAIDSSPDFSNLAQSAQRNDFVILQAWQTERLAEIKAASPATKVLVYKNLSASIADSNNGYRSTGVGVDEAEQSNPEWFLRNKAGKRFTFNNFSYLWAMDVGSASYQQRWADNVIAEMKSEGWDGVFMDDTNTTMGYHYEVSKIAAYPSDSAWQAATKSALAQIGPRIKAAGKLAIPNIGSWGENPDVGRSWLKHVDGAMDEMFVKWGSSPDSGYAWEGRWENQLESLKYAQDQGKEFLAVSHSTGNDQAAARYGWASVLLGANGRANFGLHTDYGTENWFPAEYEVDIGSPSGTESKDSEGSHRRVFSNGIVLVNPTDKTLSVELGGTYSGSGLTDATRAKMKPNTALILTGKSDGEAGGRGSIKTGKKTAKRGKIIAKGRIKGAARSTETKLRLKIRSKGAGSKKVTAKVKSNGRFSGRIRIGKTGKYRVSAKTPGSGEKATWPGRLRVQQKHLRR